MVRSRVWVLGASAVVVAACGQADHAEGLVPPPTEGVATAGPGSGENIAAHLHYTLQSNNPEILFEDPSCPDVASAEPGATVTCEMTVGDEGRRPFLLRMDDDGIWQISDG